METQKEFIFNVICVDENLIILNKNENIFNHIKRCKTFEAGSKIISLMDKDTLRAYDTTIKLLANIIFERVPRDEGIAISDIPELPEIRKWFGLFQDTDVYTLLYYLHTRGYIDTTDDDNLEFMINVFYTLRDLKNE